MNPSLHELCREPLPTGGWIALAKRWLPRSETERLHRTLRSELAWEQRSIVLFGREVMQPRLIAWAGAVPYAYSGQTLAPRAPTRELSELFDRVSEAAGIAFNHVLVNRYRDGRDSMGFHSDDEPELGTNPTVASLSLGRPRRFVMKSKKGSHARELQLGHGDLLVMGGECQHRWRHGVPKEPTPSGERISLTFRWIRG